MPLTQSVVGTPVASARRAAVLHGLLGDVDQQEANAYQGVLRGMSQVGNPKQPPGIAPPSPILVRWHRLLCLARPPERPGSSPGALCVPLLRPGNQLLASTA